MTLYSHRINRFSGESGARPGNRTATSVATFSSKNLRWMPAVVLNGWHAQKLFLNSNYFSTELSALKWVSFAVGRALCAAGPHSPRHAKAEMSLLRSESIGVLELCNTAHSIFYIANLDNGRVGGNSHGFRASKGRTEHHDEQWLDSRTATYITASLSEHKCILKNSFHDLIPPRTNRTPRIVEAQSDCLHSISFKVANLFLEVIIKTTVNEK